jgi:hypothetical protein
MDLANLDIRYRRSFIERSTPDQAAAAFFA